MIYKTVNNEELEYNELENLLSFIVYLSQHSNLYYRGESYSHLKAKLNINEYNTDKLGTYIFLLGEKGKVYRKDVKNSFKKGTKIFPINSTNDDVFKYIFDKLHRAIKTTKNTELIKYFDKEIQFNFFFQIKIINLSSLAKSIQSPI